VKPEKTVSLKSGDVMKKRPSVSGCTMAVLGPAGKNPTWFRRIASGDCAVAEERKSAVTAGNRECRQFIVMQIRRANIKKAVLAEDGFFIACVE
jgi:hypothetical protein